MAERWIAPVDEFPAADSDDDRVYEDIEAPKFVDLSAPEPSRPDDASWFCARIGCDQQHEEIDPDTIHKTFVIRVMAARSPNVRFQRLLHRQARSAMRKCPRTEPVKCVNDHRLRFAEKIKNARLRAHPISCLRSTANVTAIMRQSVGDMNTPCSRKRPCTEEALPVSKSKNLGAPQSLHGLKKLPNFATPMISQTPEFQICSAMKRLMIDSQHKGPVEHSLKTSSCPWRSRSNVKVRPTPLKSRIEINKYNCILDKEKDDNNNATSRKKTQAIVNNINYTDSRRSKEGLPASIMHAKSSVAEVKAFEGGHPAEIKDKKDQEHDSNSSSNCDDDKENTSALYNNRELLNSEKENANCEPCDHSSQKSTTAPGKVLHENSIKHKKIKPTNIKPFRFRTDERGILKEANNERKSQHEDPLKEIKPTGLFPVKSLINEKFSNQKKRLMKSKGVLKSKEEEEAILMTNTPSRVRKRTTVPKEPIFHQMHLPRSCTKRPSKSAS